MPAPGQHTAGGIGGGNEHLQSSNCGTRSDQAGFLQAGVPTAHRQSAHPVDLVDVDDIDLPVTSHLAHWPSLRASAPFFASEMSRRDSETSSPFNTSLPWTPTSGPTAFDTPSTTNAPCYTPSTDSPSLGTSLSKTADQQSSVEPNTPLHILQYDPGMARKKVGAGDKRAAMLKAKRRRARGSTSRLDVLKTDMTPKTYTKTDVRGKIAGTMTIFGLNQIVRAARTSEQDRATTNTRRLGACEKCKRLRKRCDMPDDPINLYEPCGRCKEWVLNSYLEHVQTVQYHPCIRASLLDLRLHRNGPTIRDDLYHWVYEKQRLLSKSHLGGAEHLLFLTQGYGEGFEDALHLKVSRFEPQPKDRTAYFWTDPSGQPRTMEMPPYFISNLEEARQELVNFTRRVRSVYIETLVADSNPIVRQTFEAAMRFAAFGDGELVSDALDCWVAARLIETQFKVFNGGAMIGMEHVDEAGHPFNGFTPVTPIMDSQLDDMVIRNLIRPFCARFLRRLKDKIDQRKRENWLEIYLSIFIMMSNMGLVMKDMATQARWKGLKPGNRGGTLTQGFMHACKTMLAYFHFACAGSIPFSIAFDESQEGSRRSHQGITPDQLDYLRQIRKEILKQETTLTNWNKASMYDDELYWCYQLLVSDWRGNIPYEAGEIDDFREEDFLSSSTT